MVIWKILTDWVICIFQMLTHFIIQYKKDVYSLILLPSFSEESLSFRKQSNSQWRLLIFQNSNFPLKARILSLATNTVSYFPWIGQLVFVHLKNYLPNTQVQIIMVCLSVILASKVVCREKAASSASSSHNHTNTLGHAAEVLCISHFVVQNI